MLYFQLLYLLPTSKTVKDKKAKQANLPVNNYGGEPITVSSAVATGILSAVEDLYRRKNKKNAQKGGKLINGFTS
jgi:hypothetical protein